MLDQDVVNWIDNKMCSARNLSYECIEAGNIAIRSIGKVRKITQLVREWERNDLGNYYMSQIKEVIDGKRL